jgi:type VI secretion system secreted protein Hcp
MVKKLRLVLCTILPACALAMAVPATSPAAVDMFLELDGIQGESKDADFAGSIDVLAWSWGASKASNKAPNVQDLSLTKYVDASSPVLFSRLTTGTAIASGTLSVVKAGENRTPYIRLCMTGVRVTSLSTGGSGGEDRLTENVTLSFATVVESYRQQKADGTYLAAVSAGWNLIDKLQYGDPNC